MRLLFRQRFFSWFDSYDIFDESGSVVYTVKGQLSWGHCLKIFDASGAELGLVQERVLTLLPKFELYMGGYFIGCIAKEFTLLRPSYYIDCIGWQIDGNFPGWDYRILGRDGACVAELHKELWNWTDTYILDIADPADSLCVLMVALAIDAEKCSSRQ